MASLLAVLYNGLFAYSGSWDPFGGWCNAQTESSVGHWFKSSMGHFFLSDGFFLSLFCSFRTK